MSEAFAEGVYVYREDRPDGQIKVGKSVDKDKRGKTLQTGNPARLVLEYSSTFSNPVESDFHKSFEPFLSNMGGGTEWYDPKILVPAISWLNNHKHNISPDDLDDDETNIETVKVRGKSINLEDYFAEGYVFTCDATYGEHVAVYLGEKNFVEVDGIKALYSNPAKEIKGCSVSGADFWRVADYRTIRQYVQSMV